MIYSTYKDYKLSKMGFGAMRLPQLADGSIDEPQVQEMVDYAMAHGVNYFDTAYPYHGGKSEIVLGKALAKYPRESFYLADKYPGHQIADSYDPEEIFEEQLKKCGVDYFDFYMLHNVNENSMSIYNDPKWGMIDYFVEQKKLGRIKNFGFSCHARKENLKAFLDRYPGVFDFCQIQLNYLDWTLQDANEKVAILNEKNIPIWVMESVRGGRLADLGEKDNARLKALRPDESIASWGYRWLMDVPGVTVILSGMSAIEQMKDNVKTFSEGNALSEEERNLLLELAEGMKSSLPCTACRYCCKGCPQGLDIPNLIRAYNDLKFAPNLMVSMQLEAIPEDKRSSACIGCGACAQACPQSIDVPAAMAELTEMVKKLPSWAEVCKERAAAAAANRQAK